MTRWTMKRRTIGRSTSAVVVALLVLGACGDDNGSGSTADVADETTPVVTTGSGGSGAPADAVVINQVPSDAELPFLEAIPVDLGATLSMDPFVVTVSSIDAGDAGQVEVALAIQNTSAAPNAGPDIYGACLDPEDLGLLDEAKSTYFSLETIEAGASASGVAVVDLPADCAEPFVQVRVLPLTAGGDRIAGIPVPAEAIG